MALPKASDNAFPSLLITEGTEPSAPAAGKQRLYIDSTTHKLKRTDSSGTDVTVESSGAVATDTIFDAKGDLAVGTGADTASKLTVGTNDKVLQAASGEATGLQWAFGLPTYAILGSDSAVSSTSFANSGLSFAVVASAKYLVEFFLHFDTNATTVGLKLALNATDAGTTVWVAQLIPTGAPSNAVGISEAVTFSKDTVPFATTSGPGTTRSFAQLIGLVTTTTNPDTVHLRHASETATLTTIYATSIGRATRIA